MILLDTHVLLWMVGDSRRLSARARQAIKDARKKTGIAAATVTLREAAWLAHNHRIVAASGVESLVRELAARVILRPITPEIAAFSVRLPAKFPRDPADCLIAATAIIEGIPLVTADADIRRSKVVETIW